jgi:2-amino-4-hydroxy-6-hydroxymethyldihydropteridine diphosphokinase
VSPLAAIGLGANLPSPAGKPELTLLAAMEDLAAAGEVEARSSLYRTEPVGFLDQPAFVNAAVTLETEMEPEELLDFLLGLERRYGRDRSHDRPDRPRMLDLDLLVFDERIVNSPKLTLPHPELARRRFVLVPLAEIAPGMRDPVTGITVKEMLERLADKGANRIEAVRKIYSPQARG